MGDIRIIAGSLRGRRLAVPRDGVRPTPDRAREGLFSILASDVARARVLDAFAGTGALGFEALSRGAAHVVFVERDRRVAAALTRQALAFDVAGQVRVLEGDVVAMAAGGRLEGPFDLILADPPYGAGLGPAFAEAAVGLLAPGGRLVVEREAAEPAVAASGVTCNRSVRYGRTGFDLLVGSRS